MLVGTPVSFALIKDKHMERTLLITGASTGIGRATAQRFARAGYTVFATVRDPKAANELRATKNIHPIVMDVTDEASIQQGYAAVRAQLAGSGLYAIINNAGITYTAPAEIADLAGGRAVMETNVLAPFRITQVFLPLLKEHNRTNRVKARVINVASWAAYMGQPFIGFYNASKAALVGLSESMYYDLGLLDVHVVVASPGLTRTPILKKFTQDGVNNLSHASAQYQAFYKPYFDHYITMSEASNSSSLFNTPEKLAERLMSIAEKRKPRFKYNMALDAVIVDKVITRLLPFSWRAALNRRTFKLNKPRAEHRVDRNTFEQDGALA